MKFKTIYVIILGLLYFSFFSTKSLISEISKEETEVNLTLGYFNKLGIVSLIDSNGLGVSSNVYYINSDALNEINKNNITKDLMVGDLVECRAIKINETSYHIISIDNYLDYQKGMDYYHKDIKFNFIIDFISLVIALIVLVILVIHCLKNIKKITILRTINTTIFIFSIIAILITIFSSDFHFKKYYQKEENYTEYKCIVKRDVNGYKVLNSIKIEEPFIFYNEVDALVGETVYVLAIKSKGVYKVGAVYNEEQLLALEDGINSITSDFLAKRNRNLLIIAICVTTLLCNIYFFKVLYKE